MSEADTKTPSFLATLFDPRCRMTPGQYWAAVVISLLLLPCIVIFMAMASDPRGTDSPLLLAVPLLGIFLWVFVTAMVNRLRDAGKSPWLAFVFLFALIGWLGLGAVLLWDVWPLLPLGAFGLLALISHFKPIDRDERASDDAS
jgi:uncharacterized membrane protein YhaH (DUF805 family)